MECGGGAQAAAWKTPDGKLWFATVKGLASVDPGKLRLNRLPPPVAIEEVLIDAQGCELAGADGTELIAPRSTTGQPRQAANPSPITTSQRRDSTRPLRVLVLPPRHDRVEFRFTGMSFLAPEKVCFRYQLEGYDRNWIEGGPQPAAYYTHLPAGRYVFHVTACNDNGVWHATGAKLGLWVLPHWWNTWWFRLLGGLALGGTFFGWHEMRLHRVRRKRTAHETFSRQLIVSQENERRRIAGELHDGLGQNLVLIRNRAELGLRRFEPPPALAGQLQEISRAGRQSLEDVRATAHALRPYELERLGLTRQSRTPRRRRPKPPGSNSPAKWRVSTGCFAGNRNRALSHHPGRHQ